MYIEKIKIRNFRLLKDTTLNFKEQLSMLIGRNNSGKTSFLVLFEKFYNDVLSFDYNDFSVSLRSQIDSVNASTDANDLSIQMILEIEYEEEDWIRYELTLPKTQPMICGKYTKKYGILF